MNNDMASDGNQSRKFVGSLFQPWENRWGLRGDPYLWEEMTKFLSKEPLPASVSQLMALIERAFYQLVGTQLSDPSPSIFVERYNHGGLSGGHVCGEFWRDTVLPELHRRYLAVKYADSAKSPRMIDKPCRYESYPGGCRYGTSCRFHHAKMSLQPFATQPTAGRPQQSFTNMLSANQHIGSHLYNNNQNSNNLHQTELYCSTIPAALHSNHSSTIVGNNITKNSNNFPVHPTVVATKSTSASPRSVFDLIISDQQNSMKQTSSTFVAPAATMVTNAHANNVGNHPLFVSQMFPDQSSSLFTANNSYASHHNHPAVQKHVDILAKNSSFDQVIGPFYHNNTNSDGNNFSIF